MTPYIAIDCETTGLCPLTCQVLEFAAVVEDWVSPIASLPRLRLIVEHEQITGSAVALVMNTALLAELSRPAADDFAPFNAGWPRESERVAPSQVGPAFARFLARHVAGTPTLAGKNIATFDLNFLSRLPGWPKCRHRVIDPGVLWWEPAADAAVPDTAECLRRSGVTNDHQHTALADCYAVIGMVRARFRGRADITGG